MIFDEEALAHYGTPRHSGRYPWGSGGEDGAPPRNPSFLDEVAALKAKGMNDTEIARGLGITTTQLRARKSNAKNEFKQQQIAFAQSLKDKGTSNVAIAERMNLNESTVRSLLAPGVQDKLNVLNSTTDMLRDAVAEKGMVDIGLGVGAQLGMSETKLSNAVARLKEEGYQVHNVPIPQAGTAAGKNTLGKVLAPPGTTYRDIVSDLSQIQQIQGYTEDGGRTWLGIQPPISVSSRRLGIRYKEDGGDQADGVIYVRPGAKDLSLGGSRYAQVRILVDGTHYIKGMAMYKNDLPEGTDLVFNTVKSNTGKKHDALKAIKDDPDNPFGATVRQLHDDKGKVASAMNIVNEEGNWGTWKKSISSQVLSKQSPRVAKEQLDMMFERNKGEFDRLMALSNPVVRRKLLEDFADQMDSSSVHLKAASLPGQRAQVILPIDSMKSTEIYAPNFRNGDKVALIRYPHGGTFEIPELTVNNNHREAKSLLGQAKDAVGIHHSVAERLSGADFDGDTVLVIPNNKGTLKSSPALEGLKKFDPGIYKLPEGQTFKGNKQQQMGDVSNLITDMTIRGASHDELARAVRHSMVVIDAEKKNYNTKLSAEKNGIAALKQKYQSDPNNPRSRGASTLISRAKSQARVPEYKERGVDKETGAKIRVPTGRKVIRNGKEEIATVKSKKLAETDDAFTLSSGTPIEKVYATHSNRLKQMALDARREAVNIKPPPYSPSARKVHAKEVADLAHRLNAAMQAKPRERQAQILTDMIVRQKKAANPQMDKDELKRLKLQALAEARTRTGAGKDLIYISDSEWRAIQEGALTPGRLKDILDNADMERVRELATPRQNPVMTSAKQARLQTMLNSGYTQAEIADHLGVPLSTLEQYIK